MKATKILIVLALFAIALIAGCNDGYSKASHNVKWRQTGTGFYGPEVDATLLQP